MLTGLSILQFFLCKATYISSCLFANDLFIATVISVVDLPKYARVNLLKSDVSLVIAAFNEDGYLLCDERCGALEHNNFSIDPILPDVLKFHPLAPLTTHPLYRDSHIILQDKASCLPAYLLAPPPGSNVVDCCAAPGNKTTQLASIMRNKGSITAFDKDRRRFAVLRKRVREAGATCVSPILSDILKVCPRYCHLILYTEAT
ncbi:28S rRNA (cytosine-C(5))-methyltransferase [Geodia barretti]|uniref:28S rRNA (Cytosine-C(5))-methyltransferase n=1 Tax=Geodia barretti TaxID=519541 RepID=A0AA35TQQ1_GEOBA|nr:28S rRNA (cytosine-C(5))-methyltransferase [Geodia barretti]